MKNGIKLGMDLSNMFFIEVKDSPKVISKGEDEGYVTKVDMILPAAFLGRVSDGTFSVEYNSENIEITITTINDQKDDPVFNCAKRMNIALGAPGSGLDTIPLEAFTDNRGEYPAILATFLFPRRIASWIDDNSEDGIRRDIDYEKMQITGRPDNEEKILALLVINRLIKSLSVEKTPISYEDVTAFLETYFKKPSKIPSLLKINLLTSKDAYKNSVYDYVLPSFQKTEVIHTVDIFQKSYDQKSIDSEKDLKLAVENVIESILKHHIESRRWIDPFWDGQKTIKHKGEEITIPRSPKGETKIQPTLHVILDMALSPLGIQVIRESDEGAGSLDFRFLFTTRIGLPLSVGIEFKLAHHKEIKKGITRQLPAYLKAIRSSSGVFVVMWFKDSKFFTEPTSYQKEQMEIWLSEQAKQISSESGMDISAAMLDASIRSSASSL